mmetsp:Transcript_95830/g.253164  ORF Transcript_95830/g.253164 Transcript_95830/m.253164 type:complete len:344 (+) Transcript_95830:86-1117(+)
MHRQIQMPSYGPANSACASPQPARTRPRSAAPSHRAEADFRPGVHRPGLTGGPASLLSFSSAGKAEGAQGSLEPWAKQPPWGRRGGCPFPPLWGLHARKEKAVSAAYCWSCASRLRCRSCLAHALHGEPGPNASRSQRRPASSSEAEGAGGASSPPSPCQPGLRMSRSTVRATVPSKTWRRSAKSRLGPRAGSWRATVSEPWSVQPPPTPPSPSSTSIPPPPEQEQEPEGGEVRRASSSRLLPPLRWGPAASTPSSVPRCGERSKPPCATASEARALFPSWLREPSTCMLSSPSMSPAAISLPPLRTAASLASKYAVTIEGSAKAAGEEVQAVLHAAPGSGRR